MKYDVRKNFADSRIRVKGRFVKKEEQVRGTTCVWATQGRRPVRSLLTHTTHTLCGQEFMLESLGFGGGAAAAATPAAEPSLDSSLEP